MTTTTLRGIFPEAKPVHRRNFVRENIKQLKEMQGFMQERKAKSKSQEIKPATFKSIRPKIHSFTSTQNKTSKEVAPKLVYRSIYSKKLEPEAKISHRGVQTERPEDVLKLYETGVLKYPSPSVIAQFNKSPKVQSKDHGDTAQNLIKNMQKLDLAEKPNFIKTNMKNLRTNKLKKDGASDPLQPPPTYQKGVVPKYIQEAKKMTQELIQYEGDAYSGLVLLPDDERKEYLRVARENYASLIKELNSMPMSNDTLKRRRRKMEIEDELKRLDEVIKIFQKPKVYVKADT